MPAYSEATLPALRLRKNDVLPLHGDQATVALPPVVSLDGSMVTVVVSSDAMTTTQLVRIPIDQPVLVRRPQANDHSTFVRKTRTVRSSGAKILVLDLTHPDSEIEPLGEHRYATLCVPHHSLQFHTAVSTADAISSHPEEWCQPCARVTRERAQQRVYGTRERKPA